MRDRRALIPLFVVALALLASACRLQALAFREDNRLQIVAPKDRTEVRFPVTVRWALRQSIPNLGSFVVTVNRSPQAPGKGLESFVRDLDECKGSALNICLQPAFMGGRGVYQTLEPQITFDVLPKRTGVSKSEEDRHEVTVALLDKAGRRMGEVGWTVTFTARD